MKKMITFALVMVLALTMSLSVFAGPGGFLISPGVKETPELIGGSIAECDGELVVTPYSERHTLEDEARELLEEAYDQIRENKDLSNLCEELEEIAKKNSDNVKNYAVSELFDLGYKGCTDHDDHGSFTAKLKPESLDDFVALMCLVDGVWTIVEDVEIKGDYLLVHGGEYGPYAIVVDTGSDSADQGDTGDSFPWIYVVMMAVSAAGLVALAVIFKKRSA